MNHNDMAIEAIRDELARREYWRKPDPERGRMFWSNDKTAAHSAAHPIPATLDEAAKLPAPWKLGNMILWADNWIIVEAIWPQCENRPIEAVGDTEMEARFRLRLACTIADEGTPESEVSDGHESADKCGPDCTLEVLRPGQVQCNRDGAKCPNRNDNGTERKETKR